jgi:hypothetical protein
MADYTDWRTWAAEMSRRPEEMREAFREGTENATAILHAAAKDIMARRIYDIPEDRTGFSYRRTKETDGNGIRGFQVSDKTGKRKKYTKKQADGTRAGRKKWTRTGNLRRSETKKVLSATQGLVENTANYALPRHDLGLDKGHPLAVKGSSRKSTRLAPWRTLAVKETYQTRFDAYRAAILKVFER